MKILIDILFLKNISIFIIGIAIQKIAVGPPKAVFLLVNTPFYGISNLSIIVSFLIIISSVGDKYMGLIPDHNNH